MKVVFLLVMINEVTINLNELDVLTKNIIMSTMNNTVIIIVNKNANGLRGTCWSKANKAREAQR